MFKHAFFILFVTLNSLFEWESPYWIYSLIPTVSLNEKCLILNHLEFKDLDLKFRKIKLFSWLLDSEKRLNNYPHSCKSDRSGEGVWENRNKKDT